MATDCIPPREFAARRDSLRRSLGRAIGLVFAGQADPHVDPYQPHPHFLYLTGITDEPGAALLLDPIHPVAARREMLFLRPLNPELEKWDGYRMEIGTALRERLGVESVFRLDKLAVFLHESARRARRLACLHPLALHTQPVSPDLEVFRKVAERIPGIVIEDQSEALARLRAVKSKAETAMLEQAIAITAMGFEAAMQAIRPDVSEFDVQEVIEHAYRTNGARRTSFPTIAGAGINATVLHYRANDQPLRDGDLICIDSGAQWQGYHADITRTCPVSGRFTSRQREVYDTVLAAQLAAIRAVKPGARIAQIDAAARTVIKAAGFGDFFIHGIGHHLGLETHDITPDAPLKAGAVITIEPGIYIPEEKIGIRIEDDVLVTSSGGGGGRRVLSAMIPKKAEEIEQIMSRRSRRKSR